MTAIECPITRLPLRAHGTPLWRFGEYGPRLADTYHLIFGERLPEAVVRTLMAPTHAVGVEEAARLMGVGPSEVGLAFTAYGSHPLVGSHNPVGARVFFVTERMKHHGWDDPLYTAVHEATHVMQHVLGQMPPRGHPIYSLRDWDKIRDTVYRFHNLLAEHVRARGGLPSSLAPSPHPEVRAFLVESFMPTLQYLWMASQAKGRRKTLTGLTEVPLVHLERLYSGAPEVEVGVFPTQEVLRFMRQIMGFSHGAGEVS